ncbi:Lipoprotein signal peptidase OS=Streptomyces alboniger OX=132473 GN=lspA PE=3 SV=1 [Streptomyces alboniger]
MAEAERIIGTPDIPETAGPEPERSGPDADGTAAGTSGDPTAEERGEDAGQDGPRSRGRRRIAVLFTVAAVAYALDLISKMIVVAKLEHQAMPRPWLGPVPGRAVPSARG